MVPHMNDLKNNVKVNPKNKVKRMDVMVTHNQIPHLCQLTEDDTLRKRMSNTVFPLPSF